MASTSPSAHGSASTEAAVRRLVRLYEQLAPADLPRLGHYYAADARFKDPFHTVQGVPAIARIFEHMFTSLHAPRFIVTGQVVQADQAFLVWEFRFRFRRGDTRTEQCVHGTSHLRFDRQGLVVLHRDYWDAAEELYEKLPGIGMLMRWLKGTVSR
jgi:steroid delta-isomerase